MGARSQTKNLTSDPKLPPAGKRKVVKRIDNNIFVVQATIRRNKFWKTNLNMVIIRQGEELTLVNAVRLNDQSFLQQLGYVARVIRLGTSTPEADQHDLYYKNLHGAQIWSPGIGDNYQAPVDRIFDEETLLPFAYYSEIFLFKDTLEPEAALLLRPKGSNGSGILLTSEALQDQFHNELLSATAATAMNFSGMMESAVVIAPKWLKINQGKVSLRDDFERLLRLDFSRIVSATGALVPSRGKEKAVIAVEKAFPVW